MEYGVDHVFVVLIQLVDLACPGLDPLVALQVRPVRDDRVDLRALLRSELVDDGALDESLVQELESGDSPIEDLV